jgi:hypothetical protein
MKYIIKSDLDEKIILDTKETSVEKGLEKFKKKFKGKNLIITDEQIKKIEE